MSDAAVRLVLGSRLHPNLKRIAVAFAHHANHQTFLAWCSVGTVAGYWRVSRRSVQLAVRELERLGILVLHGSRRRGAGRPTQYVIRTDALDSVPECGHSDAWNPKVRNQLHPLRRRPQTAEEATRGEVRSPFHPFERPMGAETLREPEEGRSLADKSAKPAAPEHIEQEREQKIYRRQAPVREEAGHATTTSRLMDSEKLISLLVSQVRRTHPGASLETLIDLVLEACRHTFLKNVSRSTVQAAIRLTKVEN